MGQAGLVGLQLQSMCSEPRDKFVTEYFMKVDRGGETAPLLGQSRLECRTDSPRGPGGYSFLPSQVVTTEYPDCRPRLAQVPNSGAAHRSRRCRQLRERHRHWP